MKKIVFVVLLAAAAACSKKGSDCDTAIAKGMETVTASLKEHAPNPQMLERSMGMLDKLRTTMVAHCKADGWSPEATACYAAVANRKDMESCKSKMTPEQVTKLQADVMQVMMSGGMRPGAMGGMPPGMPGHPGALAPNTPPPPGGADPAAAPAPGAPAGSPPAAPPAPGAAPAAPPPPAAAGSN